MMQAMVEKAPDPLTQGQRGREECKHGRVNNDGPKFRAASPRLPVRAARSAALRPVNVIVETRSSTLIAIIRTCDWRVLA